MEICLLMVVIGITCRTQCSSGRWFRSLNYLSRSRADVWLSRCSRALWFFSSFSSRDWESLLISFRSFSLCSSLEKIEIFISVRKHSEMGIRNLITMPPSYPTQITFSLIHAVIHRFLKVRNGVFVIDKIYSWIYLMDLAKL